MMEVAMVVIGVVAGTIAGVAMNQPRGERSPGLVLAGAIVVVGVFVTLACAVP